MTGNDELLAALATEDPARGAPRVAPTPQVLASILAESAEPALRRRRLGLVSLSAPVLAVAVAAIVIAASLLGPQSAFATWSVEPGSLDPAFAAAMQDNCLVPRGIGASLTDDERILADLPLVVMDQRGRAAVALFAERRPDGQATVMCMTIASEPGGGPVAGGGGWALGSLETPVDGPLRLFTAQRNDSDAGTYTAYAGSVEPEVVGVTVKRNDGSEVVATVSNGYFLVWWPGETFATRFVGKSTEGAAVAAIGNNGWDLAAAGDGDCLPLIGGCFGSPARDLPPIDTAVSGELIETGNGAPAIECRGLSRDRCTSAGSTPFGTAGSGIPREEVERVVVSCYGEPCTEAGGAFRVDVVLRAGGSREVSRGGYGDFTP